MFIFLLKDLNSEFKKTKFAINLQHRENPQDFPYVSDLLLIFIQHTCHAPKSIIKVRGSLKCQSFVKDQIYKNLLMNGLLYETYL